MILVDTSVWVNHLLHHEDRLAGLLEGGAVLSHPLVVGELSCGCLRNRISILRYLRALPVASVAKDGEVAHLLEERKLWGRGVGWIDIHLLASAILSGCHLWTADRRLEEIAGELGVGARAKH